MTLRIYKIDTNHTTTPATQPAAGHESRAIPPIGAASPNNGEQAEPKLPAQAEESPAMEHKAAPARLAQTLRLQRYNFMGNYRWIQRDDGFSTLAKPGKAANLLRPSVGMPQIRSPIDGLAPETPSLVNIKTSKKTTKLDI